MWGEGELATLELAKVIDKKSNLDFDKISNIAYRNGDSVNTKCILLREKI